MKFYKMMLDDEKITNDNIMCKVEGDYEKKYNITKNDLYIGSELVEWNDEIKFTYSKSDGNKFLDFIPNNLGWYIVSENVKVIFSKLKIEETQFLPIQIKERESEEISSGYYVINFLNMIDAFDRNNSEFKELKAKGTMIYSIKKYSLIGEQINGYNCFRIPENKFAAFLSEKIVNEMFKQKISGIDFLEVAVN